MNRISLTIILMSILIAMPQAFVLAAPNQQMVWLEAEKEAKVTGDYKVSGGGAYSNGELLLLDSTDDSKPHQADFNIKVANSDKYDLWILSSLGSVTYVSNFKWDLDNAGYKVCPGGMSLGTRTTDSRNVPMYWHKLTSSQQFDEGNHKLSFLTEKKRAMGNDFLYHALDVVALVPSTWEWSPNGISKPFDKQALKVNYVSGAIDKTTANAGERFKATFSNTILEKTDATPFLYAMLAYKGQVVSKAVINPKVEMNKWKLGKNYKDTADITVPFNVPDGDYEVYAGIVGGSYVDKDTAKIADIKIGKDKKNIITSTVQIKNLTVQNGTEIKKQIKGNVTLSLNKAVSFDTTAYLSFWKDDILWYVAELGNIQTSKILTEVVTPFEADIKENIPSGEYIVKYGLHKIDSSSCEGFKVNVDLEEKDDHYKPLGNGILDSKKTGLHHFWYVNQNHTLIWDGKPYIPMGGMYCSSYITSFNIDNDVANKKNWDTDMATLKMLKDKGVVDISINAVTAGTGIPAWAWQAFIDKLEENGFNYALQLNGGYKQGAERMVDTYLVRANEDGETIKVENINKNGVVSVTVPSSFIMGSTYEVACAYIAVDNATGKAVASGFGTGEILSGAKVSFSADINIGDSTGCTVFFTPKIKQSVNQFTNMWDAGDITKGLLRDLTSKLEIGDNLRALTDPITNESGLVNWYESMKFISPNYEKMNQDWLVKKYSSIDKLNEAWKIEPSLSDFEQAARILPLHTGKKGGLRENLTYAFDVETSAMYSLNIRDGIMWDDYLEFRDELYLDFNNDVADLLKENTNVPVIFKHTSYLEPYFINNKKSGGFDGIGSEAYGDYSVIRTKFGFAHSETEQFEKTAWLTVTETQTGEDIAKKNQLGIIGYPSKEYMFGHFDTLYDSGARGIWDFLFFGEHDPRMKVYSYVEKPESLDWLKEYRAKLLAPDNIEYMKDNGPIVKPYYIYPAGQEWWYQPNKRASAIYNDDYQSTRAIILKDNTMVEHTFDPSVNTKVLFVTLEDKPATTIWGPKLVEELEKKKTGKKIVILGLRKDLGSIAVIDQYYTQETQTLENGDVVQILNPPTTAKILYTTPDGKPWGIIDGDLYIIANSKWNNAIDLVGDVQESPMRFVDSLGFSNVAVRNKIKTIPGEFSDIEEHWAKAEIKEMTGLGIVNGVDSENFLPDNNVTRAEFLAMIFRGLKINLHQYNGCYDDVEKDEWYADVVQTAKDMELIPLDMLVKNNFMPKANINRQEMATIVATAYNKARGIVNEGNSNQKFKDQIIIQEWAAQYVGEVADLGIISGMPDGRFEPYSNATRAEATVIIKRFLDKK